MLSQKAWGIIFVVILGQVLNALSHRILNVAAPTLASSLATNLDGIVWVINAYQIAVTGLLLVFGRIADSIGRGRTYVIGLIVFTLGSALSAASSDLTQLIIFRVLQGVGGSMMSAAGLAVLAEFFPESQRGRVLSISLVAYQVGAFLGPSAGGFLIEYFPWQSIFLLNVVMGTPAIILGMKYFGAGSRGPRPVVRIDFFGAAMLLTVMASLTYGLEISSTSPTTIGYVMLVVPVLSALILVGFERKIKEPSLDMKLFKVPAFFLGVISALLINIVMMTIHFLLPFYLQGILQYSPSFIGLLLLIHPISTIFAGLPGGTLSDRIGAAKVSMLGAIFVAIGMASGLFLNEGSYWYHCVIVLMILGIGNGLFNPSNNSAVLSSAPKEKLGVASATMQMIRNTGWTLGSPIASSVFLLSFQSSSGLGIRNFEVLSQHPSIFVSSLHAAVLMGLLLAILAAGLAVVRTSSVSKQEAD